MEVVQPGRKPIRVVVRGDLEVGRDCDGLLLGDPRTSRRHATLMANAGGLTVLDLGSSNGTFVSGNRVVGPTPVVTERRRLRRRHDDHPRGTAGSGERSPGHGAEPEAP